MLHIVSDARECRVKISQQGLEIAPVTENGMPACKLQPDTFGIEERAKTVYGELCSKLTYCRQ